MVLNVMNELDKKSENLLSNGIKISFNGKIYNFFGFSKEKEYFVISSAKEDYGFINGREFDKSIPISISEKRIDKDLFYKKVYKKDIEDIFNIVHYSYYKDIPCCYEITTLGSINIKIDKLLPMCSIIPGSEFMLENGFITEQAGDNQWDSRSVYIKKDVLFDPEFTIKIVKLYPKCISFPFKLCNRKYSDKSFDIEVNIKDLYSDILDK